MVKKNTGVAFYGKVRIPTIGHRAAIDQAKDIAKSTGGRLTIGLSGTAEPLDLKTKKAHAEKVFGHPVETGVDHTKTLSSFLSHLHKNHDELHLVAGSDRVEEYKAFLRKYNGIPDRSGKVPFNFKRWTVHAAGGERVESDKDPRKMKPEELTSSVSASKLEKLAKEGNWEHFKAYHPGMPDSHVRKVYNQIRKFHSLKEEIGLTFARSEMPQIGASKSFVNYLKQNDVSSVRKQVIPAGLKSSQMEFDHDKIEGLRSNPSKNPIIVSNDGHVIDGHHRWMADKLEGRPSDAYVCDLPVLDLLYHAKNYSQQLNEDITHKEFGPMLDSFVSFASKHLGLNSTPKVRVKTDDDDYNSFAAYRPMDGDVSVATKNRHPMDVFRSVAHELVHHKQKEEDRIGKDVAKEGETGSDIENEANATAGVIMRNFAKENPDMFKKKHIVENKSFGAVRSRLNEGINDPGKLKAIFLAGGPGSGKDFVMNAVLTGEGLREINSDVAFEYLMRKNGLDMEMPDEERVERDIVRGRAKNITKEQERLALSGRLGLIINGTADDLEKIKTVKQKLEDDGYETMMVFVNTSNEVSRQRNVERGKMGKRKVPDGTDKQGNPDNSPNIRQEKWDLAQKNIGELQKIFGNQRFAVIDNTADMRKVSPEEKEKIQASFNRVRTMAQQFVRATNQNPNAKKWIEGEAQKRGITYQEPKRYKTLTQIRNNVPDVIHKPDNEIMAQARRLGLSYYGFGRFGRKVNGINKVLFHSKGGKLVKVQAMNEEKNPCWKGYKAYGMKKKNGKEVPNCVSEANESFENFMKSMGNKKKIVPKKKALSQEAAEASVQGGMNFGADGIGPTIAVPRAGTPYGFGYTGAYSSGISESIQTWMQSERTQKKFADKYGDLWEEKLVEAALRLEESGCGCEHTKMKKSVKKVREGMEGGVNNLSPIATQRKDELQETINKEGGKFVVRSKTGKNLGKSDTKEGAVKRLRQVEYFKHMKEEKGRPTRKAMSLRRWNCEE